MRDWPKPFESTYNDGVLSHMFVRWVEPDYDVHDYKSASDYLVKANELAYADRERLLAWKAKMRLDGYSKLLDQKGAVSGEESTI